jgi:23S rRNA (pseudouridine1915-N3)-methyltransferase
MRIHLIAVGTRMPGWVEEGYQEYARRLRGDVRLELQEVPAKARRKGADLKRIQVDEGKRQLQRIPSNCAVWALDQYGSQWDTKQLAQRMGRWMQDGRDLALLVGGPEGLSSECLQHAEGTWALSKLTLPHPLVRVVVAEQLYRAWSLMSGHPYHR